MLCWGPCTHCAENSGLAVQGVCRVLYRNASRLWLQPAELLSIAVTTRTAVFGGGFVLICYRESFHFLQAVWERIFGQASIFCSTGFHTSQPLKRTIGNIREHREWKWIGNLKIWLFPNTLLMWQGCPADNQMLKMHYQALVLLQSKCTTKHLFYFESNVNWTCKPIRFCHPPALSPKRLVWGFKSICSSVAAPGSPAMSGTLGQTPSATHPSDCYRTPQFQMFRCFTGTTFLYKLLMPESRKIPLYRT